MPSIQERILADVFAAVEGMAGGRRFRREVDVRVEDLAAPEIVQVDGAMERQPEAEDTGDGETLAVWTQELGLVAVVKGRAADLATRCTAEVAAVRAAVMADPGRGGLALVTRCIGASEPIPLRGSKPAAAAVVVGFEVEFHDLSDDPDSQ